MKAKDLKNSILQMAVEGKLVPQDPADEPASALLERIREERRRLIAEKKIKAPKGGESVIYLASDGSRYEKFVDAKGRESEPVCIDDEIPFDVPEGWEWARVKSITNLINGKAFKPSDWTEHGLPIVRIQNLNIPTSPFNRYDGNVDEDFHLHGGELLFAWSGTPGTSFGAHIWYGDEALLNQHIFKVEIAEEHLDKRFLRIALNNRVLQLMPKAHGSAGLQHVTRGVFESVLIPLPPLAEQRRIAGRVADLMPLVEEYGRLECEREALDASLPERLRKSVLQEAVRGRLVPQDPADEPASVLLERIRAERAAKVAAGELKAPRGGESTIYVASDGAHYEKRGEGEPVCIEGEIPFDVPVGWEWARLGLLFSKMGSGSTPAGGRKVYKAEGPMLIRSQNVHNDGLRLDDVARFDRKLYESRGSHVLPHDMLLNITGASIGRCAIVPEPFEEADVNQHVLVMRPLCQGVSRFVQIAITSPFVQQQILESQVGATKEGLSATKAQRLLVPLPPLAEQRRIVAKVDELTALTNQLPR